MEEKKLTGRFYDIQGFSVHDGPGSETLCSKGLSPALSLVSQSGVTGI
jgi:hypothetical protein